MNIESLQEMEQHHVDYYLEMFDGLTKFNGQIYLSNARDYVFKGIWNIPIHWKSLFISNTPRSWSADHPTHILQKTSGDYKVQREILEGAFQQQINSWHDAQLLAGQKLIDVKGLELNNDALQEVDGFRSLIKRLKVFFSKSLNVIK